MEKKVILTPVLEITLLNYCLTNQSIGEITFFLKVVPSAYKTVEITCYKHDLLRSLLRPG